MSTYYKIGELAKLYGISTDVLRYYEELGILVPRRASNGYRVYRTEDLWCLNVIRDLRGLGFSMEQIRTYLKERSISSSLSMLDQELTAIDEKLEQLTGLRDNILSRKQTISMAQELPLGIVTKKELPARPCHRIMQGYKTDEEMDILIKQLVNFDREKLYIIGNNQMGSFLNLASAKAGDCREYDAVFILHPKGEHEIGGGTFLSVCYRGDCSQNYDYIPRLFEYARDSGLAACGPLLELLWIDIHTSRYPDEQLTELQLQVEPVPGPL
ncbi:MerR family transcriptional regulator [Clostridium sp. MCC353]|uniref:MerR family transcriptional regulator n=1 Tax=Clostridium sp. MCC353 TaxID=2592646 RepID=UPI001C02562D|nr:MerR family transcriptional regulator [Clostridium sp. MCC353]MBT9778196.1 MerR family transcriptional regulator [Clostridium sp. MCC353]